MSAYTVSPGEDKMGNTYLFMALTQHPAEPLKLSMLEKSVEYGNIIAALILANIYAHGIEYNGEIILESNRDKAYEIYINVCENDDYGVSDWMIGFYFQNNLIKESNNCDDQTRLKTAYRYFLKSKDKGFPKAKNSLGKIISDNKLGFDPIKNEIEMIKYFEDASELGDNYANINLGNFYLDRYFFEKRKERLINAKEKFETGAQMNSPEALVKLGTIYIEFYNLDSDESYIKEAQRKFELAVSFGTNQFSAAGYFLLGNLLKRYHDLINIDSLTKTLNQIKYEDLIIECHVRAYDIFNNLISNGKTINGENRRYFNILSQSFKDIEINPLQFQLEAKAKKQQGSLPNTT